MLSRRRRDPSLLRLAGLAAAACARNGASALSSPPAASPLSTAANVRNARRLGKSDLVVSETCLGTMTFGVQNDRADAFKQLDYARLTGCNFVDTSEIYPVPLNAPEWRGGATEEVRGRGD